MGLKKFPKTLDDPLTGYVVYQPDNYDKNKKYPVIIFFHGQGEQGNGNVEGLYTFINAEWNNFMSGLVSNKWILVAPQLITPPAGYYAAYWSDNYLKDALRFARQYSIDEDRKIILSISLGGQMGWTAPANTTEFAGVLNICCVGVQTNFCNIKAPVWAFHAEYDPRVSSENTKSAIAQVKACNPPTAPRMTILSKNYHEIWGEVLSPVLLPNESQTAWQWMEQQKRGATVEPTPPIVIPPAQPSGLKADGSATLTSVNGTTATLDGSKSEGYKLISWVLQGYPNGGTWNIFPNYDKIGVKKKVENLVPGEYTFQLLAEDGKGGKSTDTVKLNVVTGKQQVGTGTANGQPAVLYSDNTWK